jgi:NACalpha-BTF3-like transcription factor
MPLQLKVKGTIFCQSRRPERVPFDLGALDADVDSGRAVDSQSFGEMSDALAQDKAKLFSKSGAKPLASYYDREEAQQRSGNLTFSDTASSSSHFAPPIPPVPRFATDSGSLNDIDDSHDVKSTNHVSISTSGDPTINLADVAMIVDITGCSDNDAHDALVECFGTYALFLT